MKKALLASTTLVGASLLAAAPVAAAEPPTLSFSGFTRVEASFSDQDLSAGRGRGYGFEVDDNWLIWTARGTADNGLKYVASTSVESRAAGTINVIEAKLNLTDTWGTLIMGDDDSPDDVMMVGGYSLLTAGFGYDGGYSSQVNRGGVGFTGTFASLVGDTGDATKIAYFTPRWNGLQFGVSLTPDSGARGDDNVAGDADNDGDRENTIGLGLNYNQTHGDVGVRFGITGISATTEPAAGTAGIGTTNRDDISSWSIGGTLSYSGFSVGVGHGDNGTSNCTVANVLCDQGDWWDVAAQYKFGNTTIAGGRLENQSNVLGAADDDEVEVWTLGVSHNFASAPGVRAWAEYTNYDVDRTGTASDNDASYFMIGTQLAF
jgi:hypothetical protein